MGLNAGENRARLLDVIVVLLCLCSAKTPPSGADSTLQVKGRGALALGFACVCDFHWVYLETGNPSGADPAPKV